MNDPSSFQLAGPLTYNEALTISTYGGWGGYRKTVTFTAPIRGKNAMGALILKTMICVFGVNTDDSLTMVTVFDSG